MLVLMIAMMQQWREVFAQRRTMARAISQALVSLCLRGRHTIASAFVAQRPAPDQDWSADYKLHARSEWEAQDLFKPVLREALKFCPDHLLPLAVDDTRVGKTGKKIASAFWGRDPLSPPFHLNLKYGIRYLHAALLLPLHAFAVGARALSVYFEEVTPLPKPGKQATEEQLKEWRAAQKRQNLSTAAVAMIKRLRQTVDELGGQTKTLVLALDGSFCNRTIFGAAFERVILLARARKDARLCLRAEGGRRFYAQTSFTPEQVRRDERIEWRKGRIFHGGQWRELFYKEVPKVLWRTGSGRRELRLLVVRATPYRKTRAGKLLYRQPAYLLTTDSAESAESLLQIYFDRWQIEVAHKELKQELGLGQAQVRVAASVRHQPALTAATYSLLHLAALKKFGARWVEQYGPLPKYRREKTRASTRDLINYFRSEVVHQEPPWPFEGEISYDCLRAAAA